MVNTSQGGLTVVNLDFKARHSGDAENPVLDSIAFDGQLHTYSGLVKLRSSVAIPGRNNDTLETALRRYRDSDLAQPWIPTRACPTPPSSFRASESLGRCISPPLSGGPRVPHFPQDHDRIAVDFHAIHSPATLIPSPFFDGGRNGRRKLCHDRGPHECFFRGSARAARRDQAQSRWNFAGRLRPRIDAAKRHPVYGDTTYGVAGYNQAPQEISTLRFLDSLGNPLAAGDFFSPANPKVFVRYTDDWSIPIDALVHQKSLTLVLNSLRGSTLLVRDSEAVTMTYNSAENAWKGIYALRDRVARSGNDTLESQFRGELSARALSHSNAGAKDGDTVKARLVVAYPDQLAPPLQRDFEPAP